MLLDMNKCQITHSINTFLMPPTPTPKSRGNKGDKRKVSKHHATTMKKTLRQIGKRIENKCEKHQKKKQPSLT